jgi:nucleoside-diphosphate-sugar epimerase
MGLNKHHPLYIEDLDYILSTKGIDTLNGKRILITGATGLLGTCLIDALMRLNHNGGDVYVIAVGRDKNKAAERLGEYFTDSHFMFLQQDVRDAFPESIIADYIIPMASNTHPLAYSQYPIETIEINVKGAENALLKAVECNATLLYPSTVEVYGNARGEDIFTEDYTGNLNLSTARSCYTESKRVSEALCQSYIAEKGAKVKIARLSRIFGPTMLMSDSKASSQFIKNALAQEDIVLKSEGKQLFSYTYMADAVAGLLYIMLNGDNGGAYNIACDGCNVRLRDFAQLCANAVGSKVIFDLPSDTERKGFSVATKAILRTNRLREAGWEGRYSMEEAIARTIKILGYC